MKEAWVLFVALAVTASFHTLNVLPVRGYTSRQPIAITGNGGFTSVNGVEGGAGSSSDPYIIRGWDTERISITGTTAYFIIDNSFVHLSETAGISFENVQHGTVQNSVIGPNKIGISVLDSEYITIQGNQFIGDDLKLEDSSYVTVKGNSFSDDGILISGILPLQFASHTITQDNVINGAPIYYYKNCAGLNIDGNVAPWSQGVGQLIVANCKDIRVANAQLTKPTPGTQFAFMFDSLLTGNTASNGVFGFALEFSSGNNLIENTASSNNIGFLLVSSNENNFLSNNADSNSNDGFFLYSSNYNSFTSNSEHDSGDGFLLESSKGNMFVSNVVYDNENDGFSLSNSGFNTFTRNTVRNSGGVGAFALSTSSNNTLTANTVHDNFLNGFSSMGSSNNTYAFNVAYRNQKGFNFHIGDSNNTLTYNAAYQNQNGFWLDTSANSTLIANTAHHNYDDGFHLQGSTQNTLTSNLAHSNAGSGFALELGSSRNLLAYNLAYNHTLLGGGFSIFGSSRNILLFNIAHDNTVGFSLNTAVLNILGFNRAANSTNDGFSLDQSTRNLLIRNIAHNTTTGAGFTIADSSNSNTLALNTAFRNTNGFIISFSEDNVLSENAAFNNNLPSLSGTNTGFFLLGSTNNTLSSNTIYNNPIGVKIEPVISGANLVYNNFLSNSRNAEDLNGFDNWNITKVLAQNLIGGAFLGGNFWSDYAGQDYDGDGLGDTSTPHTSGASLFPPTGILAGGDYHPLVFPETGSGADFRMFVNPSSITLGSRPFETSMVAFTSQSNFAGTIDITATVSPSSIGAPSVFLSQPSIVLGANQTISLTLVVFIGTTVAPGAYTITVNGISGQLFHTFSVAVTLQDLSISAPDPLTIEAGGTGTASVTLGSQGGFVGLVTLSVTTQPEAPVVVFSPAVVSLTAGTSKASTLRVSTYPFTAAGDYSIRMTATSGSITHSVTMLVTVTPSFALSASPTSPRVKQGSSSAALILVSSFGFAGTVQLTATAPSPGPTVSMNPASILLTSGGSVASTLTITAPAPLASGLYPVSVTGTSGSLSRTVTVTVNVTLPPDFRVSASLTSLTIVKGTQGSLDVTVRSLNDFAGDVSLTVTVSPTGPTPSLNPNVVSLTPDSSATAKVTVSTTSSTPTGLFSLTTGGFGNGISHSVTVSIVVTQPATPDFTISASPSSKSLVQGSSGTSMITLTPLNGFAAMVSLSESISPLGVETYLDPTSIGGGSGTSTLTISATSSTPVGEYTVTVTGTSGSLTHSVEVTVTVISPPQTPDFDLSVDPNTLSLKVGEPGEATILVTARNDFSGVVALEVSPPSGLTITLSTSTIEGSGASILTIGASTEGTYTLTVEGRSGSLFHSATITVTVTTPVVGDFSISANPTSLSITQGASSESILTLKSLNGFSGTISLNVLSPSGPKASLSRTSVSLSGTDTTLTLTVSIPASTPLFTYTVTVTGTSGETSHSITIPVTVETAPGQPEESLPTSTTILGLQPIQFFGITGLGAAALAAVAILAFRRRKETG